MALNGDFTLYDLDGLTNDDPFFSAEIGVALRLLHAADAQPVAGEALVLFNPATSQNESFTVIASSAGGLLLADQSQVYLLGDAGIARGTVLQSDTSIANTPCFAAGTRLSTDRGEVAVETLQPGDRLRTLLGRGLQPVTWIGSTESILRARPLADCPVRIAPGALAPGQPARDLVLSPDHAVLLDGWLVPVRHLVNGASIAHDRRLARVTYYHVELPRHDVVLAEGVPAETYLDTGNRHLFAGVVHLRPPLAAAAVAEAAWAAHGCARLLRDGPELARLHRLLCDRAVALGHRRTPDPALVLEADGRVVAWTRPGPALFEALVPPGRGQLRLLSRSGPAQHMASGSDDRRVLGVALAGLWLDGVAIGLDDPMLQAGLHAPEAGHRWTDGAACLSLPGAARARLLAVRIQPGWRDYWQAPATVRRRA